MNIRNVCASTKTLLHVSCLIVIGCATIAHAAKPVKDTKVISNVELFIGECDEFHIWNISDHEVITTEYYDKAGTLVRKRRMFKISNSVFYNSENPSITVDGGPGEREIQDWDYASETISVAGLQLKATIPGHGVIFLDTG